MRRRLHNAVLIIITITATLMFFLGAGSLDSTGTGEWLSMVFMLVGGGWVMLFFYANDEQRQKGGKRNA